MTNQKRAGKLIAGLGAAALLVTACSSGSSGGQGASSLSEFTVLTNAENTTVPTLLKSLGDNQCAAQQKALPLKVDTVPQTQLEQRVQLLAGQGALPAMFALSAGDLEKKLDSQGSILDLDKAMTDLGVIDKVEPGAISTVKNLYNDKFAALPFEYAIEGIWYNKQVFADDGIAVPTTWDELVAAAGALSAAGVQPFAASGEQGWPLTRFISGYVQRELGPTAMQDIASGKAKLTDPAYVKAATALAELGQQGYFGQGVGSIDYDTAVNEFLSGKTGMFYMGSWALTNFSDPTASKIGADNIGFIPFPTVEGGVSTDPATSLPANVGLGFVLNAKAYDGADGKVGAWLKCITENWGDLLLKQEGAISGFVTSATADVPPMTASVKELTEQNKQALAWFEAFFSTKATQTSTSNAASLVDGGISPEDFMAKVQADLG